MFVVAFSIAMSTCAKAEILGAGQRLIAGQRIYSDYQRYQLVMQTDGNLVYYRTADGAARWNSQTQGRGAFVQMQHDGNLVVYTASGEPVWNSGTQGYPGTYLNAQTDGNLVLYSAGRALWNIGSDHDGDLPAFEGDVIGRNLEVPAFGFLGHLGIYDGSGVIEVLNEPGNLVKFNFLQDFRTRTVYWGAARPNIPFALNLACYSDYCSGYNKEYVSTRVAIVKRAIQIYLIGADYTLSASYKSALPKDPGAKAVRGLYRCDTFVMDAYHASVIGAVSDNYEWRSKIESLTYNTSPIMPRTVFNKLKSWGA